MSDTVDLRAALDAEYQRGFSDGVKDVCESERTKIRRQEQKKAEKAFADRRQAIQDALGPLLDALAVYYEGPW